MSGFNISTSCFSFFLISIFFFACFAKDKPQGCKYKSPVAIFAGIDSFPNHSFTVNKQDAVEKISVPKYKMDIELYQSGCDFLQQEFRFMLHEPYPMNIPPDICANQIAGIFFLLARDAPLQLGMLSQWAAAIKADAASFKYNEKIKLAGSGITAQIDKIHQPESAVLTIVFSE
jgi:hypothetical protein